MKISVSIQEYVYRLKKSMSQHAFQKGLRTYNPQIGFCGIVIRRVESIINLHGLDS
jgi:hypothetical protein